MNSDEQYRREKSESGARYQDFVIDLLYRRRGFPIMQFVSREYQIKVGESLGGIEIKNDEKYAKTGNLWIEVGEKAMPRAGDFAPSGILRNDNTWLYIIGDYRTVFAFAKRSLQLLHEANRYPARENDRHTSIGFLLPAAHAKRWAAFVETVEDESAPPVQSMQPTPAVPGPDDDRPLTADDIQW